MVAALCCCRHRCSCHRCRCRPALMRCATFRGCLTQALPLLHAWLTRPCRPLWQWQHQQRCRPGCGRPMVCPARPSRAGHGSGAGGRGRASAGAALFATPCFTHASGWSLPVTLPAVVPCGLTSNHPTLSAPALRPPAGQPPPPALRCRRLLWQLSTGSSVFMEQTCGNSWLTTRGC